MSLLALDARWRRLNDPDRACPCCGRTFGGVFDIGFEEPEDWPHSPRIDDDVTVGNDRLTAELCRIDSRHFLRAVLPLPIRGADETFHFGLWVEVSAETFHDYVATFDTPRPFAGEGLTANTLPGFEDETGTAVTLTATDVSQRPVATATDGPLAEAQAQGIGFDDLLDIYAASGNDIRPHLTA
ncbi:DUF2199 domain-containing protein [Sagittula sp. MA-2]|jgi:hypothetical protein|uniref:DUF2199 domain-containing protein n=1 Tax=Sagittula sp. MA-2 TaxID=3048007 RepID=UPI0024C459B5|nr:DUF2199 domain-containing protein [Sagittula sp. MA-2]WHZ36986.1 DUF2199 domain-containing protein [Sagittula sp. MA-2]